MGLRLKNIITTAGNNDDKAALDAIVAFLPYCRVTTFDFGFKGLIGQIDEDKVYHDCEILGLTDKYKVSNAEEAMDNIYLTEEKVVEVSTKFPDRKFAYIDVDCFGGICLYEGFVVMNGQMVFEQKPEKTGHVNLLKVLVPDFSGYYFEPFTREFLKKNGWGW